MSALYSVGTAMDSLPARIFERINFDGPIPPSSLRPIETPCWLWSGWHNDQGYAYVYWNGRDQPLHRYRQQYTYRCPHVSCRNQVVEPPALPAAVAIDWDLPGQRIGDRDTPLADKTMARIQAGLERFARPISLEVHGNTFERRPGVRTWPLDATLSTQTTTVTKGIAVPPMLVPAGGTWRTDATPVHEPMPCRTTRENDGIAVPPLLVPTEGRVGKKAQPVAEPLRTQTARNETGLACHQSLITWRGVLGALTTRDRYALISDEIDINDCLFRMLKPHEIGRAMSFADDYLVIGNKREKVRQYGNAVTPPAAEVILSALVECVTGEPLECAA